MSPQLAQSIAALPEDHWKRDREETDAIREWAEVNYLPSDGIWKPEEFHTARPKRMRFLLLNTLGKVVRHARETLLRCTKEITRALAGAPRTLFSLIAPP